MAGERMQRRIDALLDEADAAVAARRWDEVAEKARAVLAIDYADGRIISRGLVNSLAQVAFHAGANHEVVASLLFASAGGRE